MRTVMHPLRAAALALALYRGSACAVLGFAASLPPLLVAALAAPPGRHGALRFAGFVLGFALVTLAMGAPRVARRGCVRLANRLLGAGLPAPQAVRGARWIDRLRTSAWLTAHMVLGGATTTVAGLCVFACVVFPTVWLGGGGAMTAFGLAVEVAPGRRGAWTLLVGAGCLTAAAALAVGAAAALRRFAPVLLGHRQAERLAAAQQRVELLAQRNRLAQELHDSIGHTLTASTIQAALAQELLERDPAAARRALGSIEEASRAAVDDLDHVLGVLREERAGTRPEPTLADLGPLTDRVRGAGTELAVDLSGELAQVPATVSREAYRIVQEGLTNALRHGGHSSVALRVAARDGRLEVELTNPLPDPPAAAPAPREGRQGHGLAGLEERVRLLRGELSSGPQEDGTNWRLLARIPLRSTV